MEKNGFRRLRRWAAFGLALALLAGMGAATFAGQDDPLKEVPPATAGSGMDFTYDRAASDLDADGNKISEFFKDDVLVRREVYRADRVDVYVPDGADGLVLDPDQSRVYPTDPPSPYDAYDKYQAADGRTVCDALKDGVVMRREIYAAWGSVEVYLADADGNLVLDPLQSKILPSPEPQAVDPNAVVPVGKYMDADGNTVCDFAKGDVVVRREIHRSDRMDVYVADADGNLVLSEAESRVYPTPEPPFFDDAVKYQNAYNDTIVDYSMKGVLVKREVYLAAGGMRTYLPDADGTLVLQPEK